MTLEKFITDDGQQLLISIDGKFDFSLHQSFRDAYIDFKEKNVLITLELSKATYIDSSALGMILLLKEHADKSANSLVIKKPNETVNKVLEIAQFHRLMTIES